MDEVLSRVCDPISKLMSGISELRSTIFGRTSIGEFDPSLEPLEKLASDSSDSMSRISSTRTGFRKLEVLERGAMSLIGSQLFVRT